MGLLNTLADRVKMRENRRELLRETQSSLTDDELARRINTIEWEFRRGVRDDIGEIFDEAGRYSRRKKSLEDDLTFYITGRM